MAIALMGAGFSATDTSDAVNILYPDNHDRRLSYQGSRKPADLKVFFFLPSRKKVRRRKDSYARL